MRSDNMNSTGVEISSYPKLPKLDVISPTFYFENISVLS